MSKSFKNRPLPEHRNQVARAMIIEKVGVNAAGSMKDKRTKRSKDFKKSWKAEEH